MITRPLADSRARRRGRRPRALPLSMLCFLAGGFLWKRNGAAGLGGTAHLLSLTAYMGRMSRSMQIQLAVSGLFSPLCGCRPLAKAIHPSASASGLFPLWLRAPRFLGAALSSHSLLRSGARGGSCLGGGRNPPPSSGSSSSLRIPPFAQPPSSFS